MCFNKLLAASCSALFFELPNPVYFPDFFIATDILKEGLCLGPFVLNKVYMGNFLKSLSEYSCNLVFGSNTVTSDFLISFFQSLRTNSLT